jgi:cytidine deaminase
MQPSEKISETLKTTLVQKAMEAREKAYAPYSHYQVGAALLASNDQIFTGCNIENAAYPACICAERTAIVKAVSEGVHTFVAIAVVTSNAGTPCGECRQVLNEFSPHIHVIIANSNGDVIHEMPLDRLLPFSFSPSHLED